MPVPSGKAILVLLLVALSALNLMSTLPSGRSLSGRILFDQTFSSQFGFTIDQSFKSLASELTKAGYEVDRLVSAPVTVEKLREADVLVVGIRWTDFAHDEISSIKEFVASGKGLLLIGVGWSYVDYQKQPIQRFPINVLASEFSMSVNDDVIADPTNNEGDPDNPLFHTFACHPVTYGLNSVAPSPKMNPSSLTLSGSAAAVITGDEDAYSTYHQKIYSKGTHPPVVAVNSFGSGRVVLLGHEAFLTGTDQTGGLYQYDNLKLALNIFAWLSQSENKVPVTSTATHVETSTETRTSVLMQTETVTALLGPFSIDGALLLLALLVFTPLAYIAGRRARKPSLRGEPVNANGFEVTVAVPSAAKTLAIETGPNHTMGSLVETIVSALNLPKGKAYAVEHAGALIGQAEFAKTLATFRINAGAKLKLRVME